MDIASYFASGLFKGKTVFVTGGGGGINLGIAKNFAALGAKIALCGRTQAKLDTAAVELRALGPGARSLHFRRHGLHAARLSGACGGRQSRHRG